jgi:hypothetical protein
MIPMTGMQITAAHSANDLCFDRRHPVKVCNFLHTRRPRKPEVELRIAHRWGWAHDHSTSVKLIPPFANLVPRTLRH